MDETGIAFEGIDDVLSSPDTELRLFGKTASFKRRRIGVAFAHADSINQARETAKQAARVESNQLLG